MWLVGDVEISGCTNTLKLSLWKFCSLSGSSDYLSVLRRDGTRIRYESLDLGYGNFVFNDCGKLLIHDQNNFYSLSGEGLVFESGSMSSIATDFSFGRKILTSDGDWYYRNGASLLKSTGCDFDWEEVMNDPLLSTNSDFWLSTEGDFLLSNRYEDRFLEWDANSSQWENQAFPINYAYVDGINESYQGVQAVNTLGVGEE